MPTRRFVVTGRVQGVGFRFFTQTLASREGLRGFVRNLGDGSVEVVARGDIVALDRLALALRKGPPAARVMHVDEVEIGDSGAPHSEGWRDFTIR